MKTLDLDEVFSLQVNIKTKNEQGILKFIKYLTDESFKYSATECSDGKSYFKIIIETLYDVAKIEAYLASYQIF